MTVIIYIYTSSNVDEEELASIKKTIDGLVIPRLKVKETADYIYGDKIDNMAIVLHKDGSTKNSIVDRMKKELEWLKKRWARMYDYEFSLGDELTDLKEN